LGSCRSEKIRLFAGFLSAATQEPACAGETTFTGASYTPFNQELLAFGGLIKVKNFQIALILPNLNVFI
jgi:hypothetical protein